MAEQKKQIKDIYIVHVDRYIGSYRPGKNPNIAYAPANEFTEFIMSLKEDYPGYRFRCVRNYGIEEEVLKVIIRDMMISKNKGLDK